ncbi:MAG: VanZ family protein [Nanoarchaeota archaeon]|nr:VanZ family protein [Nanoarchaeota archaeon]
MLIRALVLAESAALIVFALLPSSSVPPGDPTGGGYLFHFLAYTIYATLLIILFRKSSSQKRFFFTLGIAVLMGILTEGIQSIVPTRSADLTDLLADVIGALVGAVATSAQARYRGPSPASRSS